MFQITRLTDDQNRDCTHLIETGMNYASINAIASEIAQKTGQNIGTIELRQIADD